VIGRLLNCLCPYNKLSKLVANSTHTKYTTRYLGALELRTLNVWLQQSECDVLLVCAGLLRKPCSWSIPEQPVCATTVGGVNLPKRCNGEPEKKATPTCKLRITNAPELIVFRHLHFFCVGESCTSRSTSTRPSSSGEQEAISRRSKWRRDCQW